MGKSLPEEMWNLVKNHAGNGKADRKSQKKIRCPFLKHLISMLMVPDSEDSNDTPRGFSSLDEIYEIFTFALFGQILLTLRKLRQKREWRNAMEEELASVGKNSKMLFPWNQSETRERWNFDLAKELCC